MFSLPNTVIVRLRKATALPILECKRFVEEAGYDFDKALRLAHGFPMELTEGEKAQAAEEAEYDRLENLPFCSKEPTDDHPQDITCPHCNKEFYCRGFGGAEA
jgi:hypothetical protein